MSLELSTNMRVYELERWWWKTSPY